MDKIDASVLNNALVEQGYKLTPQALTAVYDALLTPPPARDEWYEFRNSVCQTLMVPNLIPGLTADAIRGEAEALHNTLAATLREERDKAMRAYDGQYQRTTELSAEAATLRERVEELSRIMVDREEDCACLPEDRSVTETVEALRTQAAIDAEQIAGDAETIRGLRAVLEPVASYYDQNPGGYLVKFCDQIRNLRAAIAPTPPSSDAPQAGETGAGIACEHFRQDYMPGICPTERGKRLAARIESALDGLREELAFAVLERDDAHALRRAREADIKRLAERVSYYRFEWEQACERVKAAQFAEAEVLEREHKLREELEQANRPRCDCGGRRHEGYEGQARALRTQAAIDQEQIAGDAETIRALRDKCYGWEERASTARTEVARLRGVAVPAVSAYFAYMQRGDEPRRLPRDVDPKMENLRAALAPTPPVPDAQQEQSDGE